MHVLYWREGKEIPFCSLLSFHDFIKFKFNRNGLREGGDRKSVLRTESLKLKARR